MATAKRTNWVTINTRPKLKSKIKTVKYIRYRYILLWEGYNKYTARWDIWICFDPYHSRTSYFQARTQNCIGSLKRANWLVRFRGVGRLRQAESAPVKHKIHLQYSQPINWKESYICYCNVLKWAMNIWYDFDFCLAEMNLLPIFRSASRILQTNRFRTLSSCQVSASFTELLISRWHSFILFFYFFFFSIRWHP